MLPIPTWNLNILFAPVRKVNISDSMMYTAPKFWYCKQIDDKKNKQ